MTCECRGMHPTTRDDPDGEIDQNRNLDALAAFIHLNLQFGPNLSVTGSQLESACADAPGLTNGRLSRGRGGDLRTLYALMRQDCGVEECEFRGSRTFFGVGLVNE